MAKQPAEKASSTSDPEQLPWSARTRVVVSIFIAFHVAALFIAPWSGPPPASQLSMTMADSIRPYLHALNINHGYRFFAPDPGRSSHLVRYELQRRDGTVVEGRFPDLDEQRPRLLYHRHLMIAETLNRLTSINPPESPDRIPGYAQMPPDARRQINREFQREGLMYEQARRHAEQLVAPIAQRLMIDHDAEFVRLWSVEHAIPSPLDIENHMQLTDPRLYSERPLGEFRRATN